MHELFEVLLLQWAHPVELTWQCIELFSGEGQVSTAFKAAGMAVMSYDMVLGGGLMNFLSPAGFASEPQQSISC